MRILQGGCLGRGRRHWWHQRRAPSERAGNDTRLLEVEPAVELDCTTLMSAASCVPAAPGVNAVSLAVCLGHSTVSRQGNSCRKQLAQSSCSAEEKVRRQGRRGQHVRCGTAGGGGGSAEPQRLACARSGCGSARLATGGDRGTQGGCRPARGGRWCGRVRDHPCVWFAAVGNKLDRHKYPLCRSTRRWEECSATRAATEREGGTLRLDPTKAGQPPPQAAAALNLARVLTAAGESREALALYGCAPVLPALFGLYAGCDFRERTAYRHVYDVLIQRCVKSLARRHRDPAIVSCFG